MSDFVKELQIVFSERLIKLCQNKGVSPRELEKALDVNHETFNKWYYGNSIPRFEALCAICDYFGCSIDFLLGRIEEPTHDYNYIHEETGLSSDAILQLHNSKTASIGKLFKTQYKPLCSATDYLLTTAHGLKLLNKIFDYVHSEDLSLTYDGKEVESDIIVNSSYSDNSYSLSPEEYDSILLSQIQKELILMKEQDSI